MNTLTTDELRKQIEAAGVYDLHDLAIAIDENDVARGVPAKSESELTELALRLRRRFAREDPSLPAPLIPKGIGPLFTREQIAAVRDGSIVIEARKRPGPRPRRPKADEAAPAE